MAISPSNKNTVYIHDRDSWRKWLYENHAQLSEIWLIYPNKISKEPRIPYDDAVEEALCFGWIDGIAKKYDTKSIAQRFTPRRKNSNWSELNKERCRRLISENKMTEKGFEALGDALERPFVYPPDIIDALRKSEMIWARFESYPEFYKRIRIGYINEVRRSQNDFEKRLDSFIKAIKEDRFIGTLKPKNT